jgi:signal peptidase II
MNAVPSPSPTARLFWWPLGLVVLADVATKALAHTQLARSRSYPLLGEALQFTLTYNPGAAFGLHLGPYSRWIFLAVAVVALVVLWRMYRETSRGDQARALALGLISGGALANLLNRLWSAQGVVDFIDVGIGELRWPTFNLADSAISIGAVLLVWVLWDEDHPRTAAAGSSFGSP